MKATKGMIGRAKKTLLGRGLCKLAGDRKGAVMMEYVIVAVLIAAACVVAVAVFGKTIVGMFNVAGKGAAGQHTEAATAQGTTVTGQQSGSGEAADYHDARHQ